MIPQLIHLTAPTKQLLWEERRICDRLQRLLPGWPVTSGTMPITQN